MSKNHRNFIISDMYCTKCGKKGIDVHRIAGQQRKAGHLKKLFCLNCKKETNHAEVQPFSHYDKETFMEEFELGRFIDGNRIPIPELTKCRRAECKYNKSGRCWNANNSSNCQHKIILENPNDETINLLKRGW